MTDIADLPKGSFPPALEIPYFPTKFQAVIWRNWGLIPAARLAEVLHCAERDVVETAAALGLDPAMPVPKKWLTHGYQTLIRRNWHLLDYGQLLQLLGWDAGRLDKTLREEDFFFIKLGSLKPDCPKCFFRELSDAEKAQTTKIRQIVQREFPLDRQKYIEAPFDFADAYRPHPVGGKDKFSFNYIHSYAASCGDVFLNAEQWDPAPENLLAQYASMGVKGVWMHALLYQLAPIPGAEEFSAGHEKRLAQLRRVAACCQKYGMKLYLYLNEPRSMPEKFYTKMPHWRGIVSGNATTNCISRTPEVLTYLENACRHIFAAAPGLGGVYVIAMSENATHCNYARKKAQCPHCKDLPDEEFLLRIIAAMERGIHAAAPDAEVIFSDWAWSFGRAEDKLFKRKMIEKLPKRVCYATISEWGKPTCAGNVANQVIDYSISQVGPNPENAEMLKFAKQRGLKTVAKVQINNSWELSAVPYIPVPYLIARHLDNLAALDVDGVMLSWTLGGFPGGNLALLRQTPEEMAAEKFHPDLAKKICEAWRQFSDAFAEFPFDVTTIYKAPMNYGPMTPLYLEPTNYRATMIGFPYDDLTSWRSVYPAEVFEKQWQLLTEKWQFGLDLLNRCASDVCTEEAAEYEEIVTMATAAYCHLRSTYTHVAFLRAREHGDNDAMRTATEEEKALALMLHAIVRRDSRIGFEASNHYYYTLNDLMEKLLNCEYITERL